MTVTGANCGYQQPHPLAPSTWWHQPAYSVLRTVPLLAVQFERAGTWSVAFPTPIAHSEAGSGSNLLLDRTERELQQQQEASSLHSPGFPATRFVSSSLP